MQPDACQDMEESASVSGFQETFLLKEVVTGKTEVAQSTQSPCLSFPLQCNGLYMKTGILGIIRPW